MAMASGVSSRQSVSPSNDEVYQSPGASQEDGIDHLLAQYGSLVERRPGEEGEREERAAAGGGENGPHRARAEVISERPTVNFHLPPSSSQPPRHVVTPSPRHAVSAPTSHQSTPAREEDPTASPVGAGSTGQSGLVGDTRSFSWDNVASGVSTGPQGERV